MTTDDLRPSSVSDEAAIVHDGDYTGSAGPEGLLPQPVEALDHRRDVGSEDVGSEEAGGAEAEVAEEDRSDGEIRARRFQLGDDLKSFSACGVSVVVHAIGVIVLGVLVFDKSGETVARTLLAAVEERDQAELVEIELDEDLETLSEASLASSSAAPAAGMPESVSNVETPSLDQRVVEQAQVAELVIDTPALGMPDAVGLVESLPEGEVKGEPREVVGDYQEALDRLTRELMWLLDRGPVLAIWLFDRSESMTDDQREIRRRVGNVYDQLGIVGTDNSDALWTAVASYGEDYGVHTEKPTSNRELIRQAIDEVPVDPSGKELTCQAIGRTISLHRKQAGRNRQMALIVVTDESGEPENNDRYLEAAIAEAKSAQCRIYVLGREAMFGYPYAFMRWKHPQTGRTHRLEVDRGPETAFPEQLQTDGFRRRYDAFSSGFGPYEQARMARETNGIFFLLPTAEKDLVGKENKRRYELEAMRPFVPDLRSRREVLADRDKQPLRALIWKVIRDLNPYDPGAKQVVELQMRFSAEPRELVEQIRENQRKAQLLLGYMAEAEKALEEGRRLREQEADPRWQANYDLIYAQMVAYQARIYEYGVGLETFLDRLEEEMRSASQNRGDRVLGGWRVRLRQQTLAEESEPYQKRANRLLSSVREQFPRTPWAARAQHELKRGYGVFCFPNYRRPSNGNNNNVPNAAEPPKL